MHIFKKNLIHPRELAEQACHIELNLLREPIGKQDQYIAAFGGITCFNFHANNQVEAWPLNLDQEILYNLEDNLFSTEGLPAWPFRTDSWKGKTESVKYAVGQ